MGIKVYIIEMIINSVNFVNADHNVVVSIVNFKVEIDWVIKTSFHNINWFTLP